MAKNLRTRNNKSGYREFWDPREERWVLTHRRAVENKLGRELEPGEHVHHINHDRQDNRPQNLVALKGNVHHRVHRKDNACFRCGRPGHFVETCQAKSDFAGNPLD